MIRNTLVLLSMLAASAQNAAADDASAIRTYRDGLRSIVRYLDTIPPNQTLPTRQEREDARLLWKSFLDYELGLEAIRAAHSDFAKLHGRNRDAEFRLYHAAYLAQYRNALDFIARAERHPQYHTMLNERAASLGLVSGTYADFKLRWLNVARAAEFSAFTVLDAALGGQSLAGAADDAAAILAAGTGHGTTETLRNALRVVQSAAWAPLPATLQATGSGPEKPAPRPSFVSRSQIAELRGKMRPGDLVFQRRDWALTNVGLPGFWSHVAMYVGTPAERRATFGDAFEDRVRAQNAASYARLEKATVVEAIGEGVIASTFEHSADADYIGVLRPRLAPAAIGDAIARAFTYVGRPYDFEFDFATDDRIVCTELVYKSFEGALHLPVMHLAGRAVTPANDFVRFWDETFDRAPELDFVAFLDGDAAHRSARKGAVTAFRSSWTRPRWHALQEPLSLHGLELPDR